MDIYYTFSQIILFLIVFSRQIFAHVLHRCVPLNAPFYAVTFPNIYCNFFPKPFIVLYHFSLRLLQSPSFNLDNSLNTALHCYYIPNSHLFNHHCNPSSSFHSHAITTATSPNSSNFYLYYGANTPLQTPFLYYFIPTLFKLSPFFISPNSPLSTPILYAYNLSTTP